MTNIMTTEGQDESKNASKVSRRNFVIGVGAGVVVAAIAGAGAESLLTKSTSSTTTSTVTSTVAGPTTTVTGPTTTVTSTSTVLPPSSSIITLNVNGVNRTTNVDNRWSLADTLRYKFNLIGTKVGCDRGEDGACAVLVDGIPMLSCMMLAVEYQGHSITTIEGIGTPGNLSNVQTSLINNDGVQCGGCMPGIVVVATAFHKANPSATDAQWRAALAGNLCRCGNWANILQGLEAVKS